MPCDTLQVAADAMQVEGTSGDAVTAALSTLPETEMYGFLLVLTYLVDQKKNEKVRKFAFFLTLLILLGMVC